MSITVYFNSLKGSFQFDDLPLIQSQWVENLDAFKRQVDFSSFTNRPVVLWTYALNNTIGKNEVVGFHILNLALHIGVTLLIFFIITRTKYLQERSVEHQNSSHRNQIGSSASCASGFPLATALLFSLHPLNTDSVSYISSRSSLLATFFYLLALYLFTGLFSRKDKTPIFNFRWGLSILILISAYMSIASKLIGATLPVLMGLWYVGFIVTTQKPKLADKILQPKWVTGILLLTGALFAGAYIIADSWLYIANDQGLQLYGRIPYFLVQIKVAVFYYLKLFLFPFNLNVDNGLPFSSLESDPLILSAFILIVGILFGAIKSRNLWIIAGFIWFCITLAPTSSIIPLNDLAVEHRTYLPMTLGLCMVAGWATLGRSWCYLILLIPLFGLGTITRNYDWVSEVSLWKDSAKKNPYSPRTHNNLGKAYFENGDLSLATQHLEKSVASIPKFITNQYNIKNVDEFLKRSAIGKPSKNKFPASEGTGLLAELVEPHYNLASVYLDQGRYDNAEEQYLKTLALKPNHISSKIGLSTVYNKKGLYLQAIESLQQVIKENPFNTDTKFALARLNLGELYAKTGKLEKAVSEWNAALKIDASLLPAHFNLATAYMMTGKLQLAEKAFDHCLTLNSQHEPSLFNLAKVYQMQEKWDQSTLQFKKFIKLIGPRSSAYAQIGFNFNRQADWKNAREFLEKSIALQPGNLNTRMFLTESLANLGLKEKALEHLQVALRMGPNPAQKEAINKMMLTINGDMTP